MWSVHQLYRIFDKKNRLLYIGASTNAVARMTGHRTTAPWYDRVATVKIYSFKNRAEAVAAERKAIKNEKPLFNKVNNEAVVSSLGPCIGRMECDEVFDFFGGVGATARALGIQQPSVSVWRKNGRIPYLRQLHIERVTKGKLKADGK